jgi:TRAP-type C4-dicarboxylate transport system permease small subunit
VKLSALDDAVLRVERILIVSAVAGMTVLVSADVTQRTFSRPVGKTEQLVAFLGEKLAGPLSADGRALLEGPVGGAVFALLAFAFLTFAAHSSRQITAARSKAPAPKLTGSLVLGAFVLVALTVAAKALLWIFPSSVPGAQKLALALMLWSGMLGASVATRERRHIVLDTLKKKVAPEHARAFALVSGLFTALFCGFVALLGALQLAGEIRDWAGGDGVGMYESVPLPMWIATLAIPACFLIMTVRFGAYAVRDFRFGPTTGGDGGHGVDLDKLAEAPVVVDAASVPEAGRA